MKPKSGEIVNSLCACIPQLASCRPELVAAIDLVAECFGAGGKILTCGNGGSAADAEHIVGELMKGFRLRRPIPAEDVAKLDSLAGERGAGIGRQLQGALPAISLVGHAALVTAFCNDVNADLIFAQQVYGYGKAGDVLIAISTSGNATNVINGIYVARLRGLKVIGLTGEHGGRMKGLCDVHLIAPASETYRVQEYHEPLYHALCAAVEQEIFGE